MVAVVDGGHQLMAAAADGEPQLMVAVVGAGRQLMVAAADGRSFQRL